MDVYLLALAVFVSGWMASVSGMAEIWPFIRTKIFGIVGALLQTIGKPLFYAAMFVSAAVTAVTLLVLIYAAIVLSALALILLLLWLLLRGTARRVSKLLTKSKPMWVTVGYLLLILLAMMAAAGLFFLLLMLSEFPYGFSLLCILAALAAALALLAAIIHKILLALLATFLALLAMIATVIGLLLNAGQEATLPIPPAAVIIARPEVKMRVVDFRIAKKNDGCITMTRGTALPLSLEDCRKLTEKFCRSVVVKANGVMMAPVVMVGEGWYLLEHPDGRLEWKIPTKLDVDSVYKK